MALIENTVYPKFKKSYSPQELERLYTLKEAEHDFMLNKAKGIEQQFTLALLLKAQQHLGYLINPNEAPKQIQVYLAKQLAFEEVAVLRKGSSSKKTFYRYHQAIREFLTIYSWSAGGKALAEKVVNETAYTKSDPADLINVAIEGLIEQRFALPAFSTLDRLVRHQRQQVHDELYQNVCVDLSEAQKEKLDQLLIVDKHKTISDFALLSKTAGSTSLKNMRAWAERLEWLTNLINPEPFTKVLTHTKLRQFAAEASIELNEIKAIANPLQRYTLLLCLIQQAQVSTKDTLIKMFLDRMRNAHTNAKKKLLDLHEKHQELEEQMMAIFSQVLDRAAKDSSPESLGLEVIKVLEHSGGVEHLQNDYKKVSAYHNKNYLPLLWDKFKSHRATIFKLLDLLDIKAASQDELLLEALSFIKKHQYQHKNELPFEINLGFYSQRWRQFVQARGLLKRRELELCVLSHVADCLRNGDLYVEGSETYPDSRKQLLPWEECLLYLEGYCAASGLASNAKDFVQELKTKLSSVAKEVDASFPDNTELSIDDEGKPHLKRLLAQAKPEGREDFKQDVRRRILEKEHHLLDIIKNGQHWLNFSRHYSPPSGSQSKLSNAELYYIFTVFGYGCNLGASQTERHIDGTLTRRSLKRINDQHINSLKLSKSNKDVINAYAQFELAYHWGDQSKAIADGSHIPLRENNTLGEHHIRYGRYGALAYHHISDNYIAIFSHFIACGVWEAVYILDGLFKNTSDLQPDTLHADTQGQSEPVFALSYLLGIKLMPRMRNWDDVYFYKADSSHYYEHIEGLFDKTVNWKLIETHWQDFMQVVISIYKGKVTPSMILQKLGVYSRKNKRYLAFRELGRVIRTLFLLNYISDKPLRIEIRAATTKVEAFHNFRDWLRFGGDTITSGDPVEQEKRINYAMLIANIVMLHNANDLSNVLLQMKQEGKTVTPCILVKSG